VKFPYWLSLFVLCALAAAEPLSADTIVLTMLNKSNDWDVHVRLLGINNNQFYYLTERGPEHHQETKFKIQRDIYLIAVYACGFKQTGTINLTRNVRLVFPACFVRNTYRRAPNAGEPSIEKVDLITTQPQDGAIDERMLTKAEAFIQDGIPINDYINMRVYLPPYNAQVRWMLDWYSWATGNLDGNDIFH
jgi:hypothetical protein